MMQNYLHHNNRVTCLTIIDNRSTLILPAINEVFKRSIFEDFYSFFDYKNMSFAMQFGFVIKRSNMDAVAGITEQIRQGSIDTFTCFLFELHKATDCINHELLLSKWENYSVGGKYVTWFKSLSKERRQCVQVNDILLDFLYLSAGVQQGFIRWLELLLIFINDLAGACEFPNSISCADDTVLFINYRKNKDELHLMNKFLEMFPKCLSVIKLVLNIDETQAINVLKNYDEMINFSVSSFD